MAKKTLKEFASSDALLKAVESMSDKDAHDHIDLVAAHTHQVIDHDWKPPKAATKRDITRLQRESADLWSALTDVETSLNGVIQVLLAVGCSNDPSVANKAAEIVLEQAGALKAVRDRLNSYDDQPLLKGG